MDEHRQQSREKAIREARASQLIDACAIIHHYNVTRHGGPLPWPELLTASEALGDHDEAVYQEALIKVLKLYSESLDVGLAYFKYPSATLNYEDAEVLFIRNNPGFSQTHYGRAIGNAILGLR